MTKLRNVDYDVINLINVLHKNNTLNIGGIMEKIGYSEKSMDKILEQMQKLNLITIEKHDFKTLSVVKLIDTDIIPDGTRCIGKYQDNGLQCQNHARFKSTKLCAWHQIQHKTGRTPR